MTLEEARTALLDEILVGGAALANQEPTSSNVWDQRALQQIVDSCFVKLHQLRLLQCDACEKVFHNRSRLKAHHFDAHVKKDLRKSDTTSDTIIGKKKAPDLAYTWHTDKNNLKHLCDICGQLFAFKVNMVIHKLQHSGKEPLTCRICQKDFVNKSKLDDHTKNCHTTPNLHLCDVCGKEFYTIHNLNSHTKRHGDIKPYSCEFCNKKFAFNYIMKIHRRSHTGETPYVCVCGRQFRYRSGLKSHNCTSMDGTQSSKNSLQCNYCGKRFLYRTSLTRHLRIHLNTQYSCKYCNAKFNAPSNLKRHSEKHAGEFPFPCSTCKSKFVDKYELDQHMIAHANEKRYSCDICRKRFTKKDGVAQHLKVHMNTSRYNCTECNDSFYYKCKLVNHLKRCAYKKSGGKL